MAKPFILNDESIKNSHGFYLLNAGGRLDRFNANPVMLDNHDINRLCGRWGNIRVDDSRLIADPDFDEGCALGAERKGQAERGYLKGASLALCIISAELREEEMYVTEWEAFEASVTPLPSNAGCTQLKICDNNGAPISENDIKAHVDGIVRLCAASDHKNNKPIQITMDKITLSALALTLLGLDAAATTDALSTSIVELAADRDKYKSLHEGQLKRAAESMVDLAVKDGKITADKKEAFVKLALADFDTTKSTLDGISRKRTLSEALGSGSPSGIAAERKGWTCLHWLKNDPAEYQRIKAEEPETHAAILANSK